MGVATVVDETALPALSVLADTGTCSPSGASKVPGLVHQPLEVTDAAGMGLVETNLVYVKRKTLLLRWVWYAFHCSANGSDLPKETPIPDLPVEEPDFTTLFGKNAPPAPTNGAGVRTTIGGADVDVTDKLTMTWVCICSVSSLTPPDGTVDELCYSG